jgi:NRAMP (natural resistance-associated macrophage protein)-like metal ion transporter
MLLFLAVLGPGIITAFVDNDAGGITTYSVAAATYGNRILWTVIPMTIALVVCQEMSARMGVITGKGLADLIRENFGARTTAVLMGSLLLANMANTVSEFAGVAAGAEILGIPRWVSVPIGALLVWMLIVRASYRAVEKVFLVLSFFYIAYIISGVMARPDWGVVGRAAITPNFTLSRSYVIMLIGLVGTTIAPWMQFYLQSSVVEKRIRVEEYRYSRLDVIVGCLVTDVVTFFVLATVAATLFTHGVKVETARDAALALAPLAGKYCAVLFAFGLMNASLFAASVLPLTTAYYVCEAVGWEAGVSRKLGEAPVFFGLYTAMIVIGAAVVLIPGAPLIFLMLVSQVINGLLLPFILIFQLALINNRRIMGRYVNSPLQNSVSWATTVIMIAMSVVLVGVSLFPGLGGGG